ncbi:MAG: pyridoxal-dependent decarboxylase [Patescibacteria group bacterium]
MRTGIKTAARHLLRRVSHPRGFDPQTFPRRPLSTTVIRARLADVGWNLADRPIGYNMGSLYTSPHPLSVHAYRTLVHANPGHLGSYDETSLRYADTTTMEYEVIRKMADLYNAPRDVTGYITSGGTEGNLYAFWQGQSFVAPRGKSCLLVTPLTHYSVKKAGAIAAKDTYAVALEQDTWGMNAEDFRRRVLTLYRRGYRGFIVCLTEGYSTTGTGDNTTAITREAKKLRSSLRGIEFYFWIDAALNGLVLPFRERGFSPFANPEIAAVVVDFHKFGLAPYPAGIVLYRNKFMRGISSPIDYLPQRDTTVSGSRSGIPAAAVWAGIHAVGARGLKDIVSRQTANKQWCITHLAIAGDAIRIITDAGSVTMGMMFPTLSNGRLPRWLEQKYWLYAGRTDSYGLPDMQKSLYKVFFLPHLTRRVVSEFTRDILSVVATTKNASKK